MSSKHLQNSSTPNRGIIIYYINDSLIVEQIDDTVIDTIIKINQKSRISIKNARISIKLCSKCGKEHSGKQKLCSACNSERTMKWKKENARKTKCCECGAEIKYYNKDAPKLCKYCYKSYLKNKWKTNNPSKNPNRKSAPRKASFAPMSKIEDIEDDTEISENTEIKEEDFQNNNELTEEEWEQIMKTDTVKNKEETEEDF